MTKQDGLWFGMSGAVVWAAASLFYLAFARGVIEHAFWIYALNAALVAGALLLFFEIIVRLRPAAPRRPAALAFGAPGLVGGVLLAAGLANLAPSFSAASPGRYAALLLVAYGVLIALAFEKQCPTEA